MQLHGKMKSAVCVVLVMSLMAAAVFAAVLMNAKADTGNVVQRTRDPWVDTEVLNYLFWTADTKLSADCAKLQNDMDLTDTIMAQLKSYGLEEVQRLMGTELVSAETTGTKAAVEAVNARQKAVLAVVDKETKEALGSQYPVFRAWIRTWWQEETTYRQNWIREQEDAANNADAAIDRELVYATQYAGNSNFEVALPDKYVKFANLGWTSNIPVSLRPCYANPPYMVNVYNAATNMTVLSVPVRDVGPWNEDDNYWDSASGSPSRRLFTSLAVGMPEAQAAYQNGYNGGKDQFGRTVLQPAGIDLALAVATQLGLSYNQNAWVWVRYSALA